MLFDLHQKNDRHNYKSKAFPCVLEHDLLRENAAIFWHWHEDFEIVIVDKGSFSVRICAEDFLVQEGDMLFLNSDTLHSIEAKHSGKVRTLVFHPDLVSGGENSAIETKYIQPLIECQKFQALYLPKERNQSLLAICNQIDTYLKAQSLGFEIAIRARLSQLCLFVYKHYEAYMDKSRSQNLDKERLKIMLDYIKHNFQYGLSLNALSASAHISPRACMRLFNKNLALAPMQYVLAFRLQYSAHMLIKKPEMTVAQIAQACGFDSHSNFSMLFRRHFKLSPTVYRHTAP